MDTVRSAAQKRSRSDSESSASSGVSNAVSEVEPAVKSLRAEHSASTTFTCTLAPTCDVTPSVHATASALSSHYQTYHSHTCTAPSLASQDPAERCNRLFPTAHLLSLHLSELHSPLNALLPAPYACLQPSCSQRFRTPKGRRLHAIDVHAYPREYFFAVVVWGIDKVLEKGGGMVRREWKPRPGQLPRVANRAKGDAGKGKFESEGGHAMAGDVDGREQSPVSVHSEGVKSSGEDEFEQREWSPPPATDEHHPATDGTKLMSIIQPPRDESPHLASSFGKTKDLPMDDLSQALEGVSLAMIPRSVTKARAKARAAAAMAN